MKYLVIAIALLGLAGCDAATDHYHCLQDDQNVMVVKVTSNNITFGQTYPCDNCTCKEGKPGLK